MTTHQSENSHPTLRFPHLNDNEWLTIDAGGLKAPQYPSPLEVKMLMQNAVAEYTASLREKIEEQDSDMRNECNIPSEYKLGYMQRGKDVLDLLPDNNNGIWEK